MEVCHALVPDDPKTRADGPAFAILDTVRSYKGGESARAFLSTEHENTGGNRRRVTRNPRFPHIIFA